MRDHVQREYCVQFDLIFVIHARRSPSRSDIMIFNPNPNPQAMQAGLLDCLGAGANSAENAAPPMKKAAAIIFDYEAAVLLLSGFFESKPVPRLHSEQGPHGGAHLHLVDFRRKNAEACRFILASIRTRSRLSDRVLGRLEELLDRMERTVAGAGGARAFSPCPPTVWKLRRAEAAGCGGRVRTAKKKKFLTLKRAEKERKSHVRKNPGEVLILQEEVSQSQPMTTAYEVAPNAQEQDVAMDDVTEHLSAVSLVSLT